jgi:UDP-glucuronate 4-epimerase
MKTLITGAAGFIGFHLAQLLAAQGEEVIGVDSIGNDSEGLKQARLRESDVNAAGLALNGVASSSKYPSYRFVRADVTGREDMLRLFARERPDRVCHLAAQAGVRQSLANPDAYIRCNVAGFSNVLEACRRYLVRHLVYASSSSVYGSSSVQPCSTTQRTDSPVSIYAATKKMNELMAYTYSHLYRLPATGLRFFTVYGPWGRPDMAPFIFAKAIAEGKPIMLYNEGKMYRDFTYIDDVVRCIALSLNLSAPAGSGVDGIPYRLYNVGKGEAVCLMDFVAELERCLGRSAAKQLLPSQDGDVTSTLADASELEAAIAYKPDTPVAVGVRRFVDWFTGWNKCSKQYG